MASGQLSRAEGLARSGSKHACHVMLYSGTEAQLFGRIPIRHIILMQMRFDGLLGFPGGMVNLAEETLEEGLSRELLEEVGVSVPMSVEDHVAASYAPPHSSSSSGLIVHFYVKKMEEADIKAAEKATLSIAVDHGQEVLGTVRVPLYTMRRGGGLPFFLSHSFIGNARSQLLDALLRFHLVAPRDLRKALVCSAEMHACSAEGLQAGLALAQEEEERRRSS